MGTRRQAGLVMAMGPLAGVRVLEASTGRPARIAAMLLADLGADVVRAIDPAAPAEPVTPDAVCWDRGKRLQPIASADVPSMAARADLLLVDAGPARLHELGWDRAAVHEVAPEVCHVWLPPYGEHGEWRDLPEDPILLAAVTALAVYYPADDDAPVAPVAPSLTYLHGALGAAAAVAALLGRLRHGRAQPAVVTGLHAAAAVLGPAYTEFNDAPPHSPSRDVKGGPNWRLYRCSDGEWLFLGALTPDIFFRALDALDRLDVMAHPDVGGDFYSVLDLDRGRPAVTAALEPIFASNTSAYWLARLQQARVPCAIAQSRAAWLAGPVVQANDLRRELPHSRLGTVTVPNVPIAFDRTPAAVERLAVHESPGEPWPAATGPRSAATAERTAEPMLPLDGLRVVDGSTFQAGPMISAVLADFGADVVRVEAPTGDPYRTYALSFLAVNQRKRGVIVDLKRPAQVAALHALLGDADVYVENLRPHALAALDLKEDADVPRFPGLVHCSLSAFGRAAEFADLPGFDPIFQTLSGMAMAQGGAGRPIVCPAPFNDATTGALGALGVLAALVHRETSGGGQRVWVSLAASSTFVQSGENTSWAGAPEPQQGALQFRGPDAGHRYYQCRDGWVAVAATEAALFTALAVDVVTDAERVLAQRTVSAATALLHERGVPACRVVLPPLPLRDPFLVANDYSHLVAMPEGTARVVDHLSRWPAAPEPRAARYFAPGEDTAEVLASLVASPPSASGG